MNRRRYLALCAGIAALPGCANRPPEPSETESDSTTSTSPSSTPSEAPATPTESPTVAGDAPPTDSSPTDPPTAAPASHLGWFVLWNDDDEPHRVTLTVSREARVILDETRDLSPGAAADVENPIETQGVYEVVATVDDERRAEREWRVSNCDSIEYLQVYVGEDGETEIRTMRQTIDPHPTC
ncbi:hypothetical protein C2R22_08850 [Salinigranum rubrum]|uniref:Ig-like domain-containing protein n=1 Tax=Salinigranum rubrum TaxID=755307 RepID=A0A2I8VIM6_9EURY|nr:hypothetical protein [Salinigranum rubrum]AUV81744.1 hypothetical protein C2R22_08850 [Salinigranum rubrum]